PGLGMAKLAPSSPGRFVISYFRLRRIGHDPSRIEGAHLADDGFDPRIVSRDVKDMAPGIAGPAQAYPVLVHHLFCHSPVNHIEPLGRLFYGIVIFAQLFHLSGKAASVLFVRLGRQDNAPVALTPAAIIEYDDQIAGRGQVERIAPKVGCRSAPAVGHDDGWELFARDRLEREQFRVQPDALADDTGGAEVNIVPRLEPG